MGKIEVVDGFVDEGDIIWQVKYNPYLSSNNKFSIVKVEIVAIYIKGLLAIAKNNDGLKILIDISKFVNNHFKEYENAEAEVVMRTLMES